jgi:hypothetical protein
LFLVVNSSKHKLLRSYVPTSIEVCPRNIFQILRQGSKFSHPINLPDIKLFTKYLGQTDGQEDNADLNDMDISGAMVYQKIIDRF